ncbi:hypothetical protein LEN26_009709 [Aphanomyces euteiches]|nr:hypothetical protein LEN26_009709 [Aphanomyces euteiches]
MAAPPAMMNSILAELQQLREEVARLRQEKGQSESLAHLLQEQNQRSTEEIFELHAQIVAVEAEAKYKCEQTELSMQQQIKRLVSHNTFLQEEKKSSERARAGLEAQLAQLKSAAQLEQKRLEAGKRLLETTKRKFEAERMQMTQQLSQVVTTPPLPKRMRVAAVETSVDAALQTDPCQSLQDENSELLGQLLSSDLVALLQPLTSPAASSSTSSLSVPVVTAADTSTDDLSQIMPQFSQWLPPSAVQSNRSLPRDGIPTHVTEMLLSTVTKMLDGSCTATTLVHALTAYLALDLEPAIVLHVLHVLFTLIHASSRVQAALVPPPSSPQSISKPSLSRIRGWTPPPLKPSPALNISSQPQAHQETCDVSKLLDGLVHVLESNEQNEDVVVAAMSELFGFIIPDFQRVDVLAYWVGLARETSPSRFESVVPFLCDIVSAHHSNPPNIVAQSIFVLTLLVSHPPSFGVMKPFLSKWATALHRTLPLAINGVDSALLKLYCTVTTMYPLESLHRLPRAMDTLWDFAHKLWAMYDDTKSQEIVEVLHLVLNLVANAPTTTNVLDTPNKQGLVTDILQTLPNTQASSWILIRAMDRRSK